MNDIRFETIAGSRSRLSRTTVAETSGPLSSVCRARAMPRSLRLPLPSATQALLLLHGVGRLIAPRGRKITKHR